MPRPSDDRYLEIEFQRRYADDPIWEDDDMDPVRRHRGRAVLACLTLAAAAVGLTQTQIEKQGWDALRPIASDVPYYDNIEHAFSAVNLMGSKTPVSDRGRQDAGEHAGTPVTQSPTESSSVPTFESAAPDTTTAEPSVSAPAEAQLAYPAEPSAALPPSVDNPQLNPPVSVTDPAGFQAALDAAAPGTAIVVEPGTYSGNFVIAHAGTPEQRIDIQMKPGAVLEGKDDTVPVLQLQNADYVRVGGVATKGGQNGIAVTQTDRSIIEVSSVTDTGGEGVVYYAQSRDNTLNLSGGYIENTGQADPEFGEGVFLGSLAYDMLEDAHKSGQPPVIDQTDRNMIVGDGGSIRNATQEAVEISEGTFGNRVEGISINADRADKGVPCILDNGRSSSIVNTDCAQVPNGSSAILVEPAPDLSGSGENGIYGGNSISSAELATGQFVVSIDASIKGANVICDPAIAPEKLSNVPCRAESVP
jgi:hypothetical protein